MIKYEDVVIDFDNQIKLLLNFLELDWQKNIRNFQKTAEAKSRINTPSYSQVVQPLYSSSINRWENYIPVLKSYFNEMKDTIEDLGYSTKTVSSK